MKPYLRVVLCGFSAFEQRTLGTVLRLAGPSGGSFVQVAEIADADLVVADADVPGVLSSIVGTPREAGTVFIGKAAPEHARQCLRRPIDPMQVLRELNSLCEQRPTFQDAATQAANRPQHTAPARLAPAPPAAGALPSPASALHAPGAATAATGALALVVDDSAVAAQFLRSRLQHMGLGVEVANNSQHALELLARSPFGWVFLDVELGESSSLDGLALCQHIKRWNLHPESVAPTVVMVSAHHSPLDRVRGTFAGCDHYLAKPLDEVELARLVMPPTPKAGRHDHRRWPATLHSTVPSRS